MNKRLIATGIAGAAVLLMWALSSRSGDASSRLPASGARGILQERFAKGEVSEEEFAQQSRQIQRAA